MTRPADPGSRTATEVVRDRVGERETQTCRPALVDDDAGGDPIVYDDERDEAVDAVQHQRP